MAKSLERQADGSFEMTDTKPEGVVEKCDAVQAFLFDPSSRARIGHLSALMVKNVQFPADIALPVPMWANLASNRPTTYPKVVGVLQSVSWPGGKTDPITLEFLVSAANWQSAMKVEYQEDDGAADDMDYEACEFAFVVYDYDPVAKLVYKSFHTNETELEGEFRFNDTDYVVANVAFEGIRSPQLYAVKMVVKPKLKAFSIFVGLGDRATITKGWGDAGIKARQEAQKAGEARRSHRIERKKQLEEAKERKKDKRTEKEKERDEAKKAADAAKVAEDKRKSELAEKEKDRAEKAKQLEVKLQASRVHAEAARKGADEEAAIAALLAAAADAAEVEKSARDRIRAQAAEEQLQHDRAFQAALASFQKRGDAKKQVLDKGATKAENDAYLAEADLDDERKRLLGALGDAQMRKQPAEVTKVQRLLHDLETKQREAEAKRRALQADSKKQSSDAKVAADAEQTEFEKPFGAKRDELRKKEELLLAECDKRVAAASAQVEEYRAQQAKKKEDLKEKIGKDASAAQKAILAQAETLVAAAEVAVAPKISEALSKAEAAEGAAKRAETAAVAAAKSLAGQAKTIEHLEEELAAAREFVDSSAEALRRLERKLAEARLLSGTSTVPQLTTHDFRDDLSVALKLTIDGKATEVTGSSVTRFSVASETWGYQAEIEFMVALDAGTDALNAAFIGQKLVEVELSLKSKFQPETDPPDAFLIKGIARERRIVEDAYDALSAAAVLRRRYWLSFADPAQVLWRQHRPTELFNEKKLQDVVDAHKGAKITITGDWAGHWDQVKKFIFLGLGDEANRASFYDLLIWYIDRHRGCLVYDTATNAYKVVGTKPADGTAKPLDAMDIDIVEISFPEVQRHSVNVLNAWTEAATKKKEIALDVAVAGVKKDILVRTDIASRFDARGTLETARLVVRKAELHLVFATMPTVTFAPGVLIDFTSATWPAGVFSKSLVYRVRSYSIAAVASASRDQTSAGSAYGSFDLRVEAVLEDKTDTAPHLPPYTTPAYPVYVEGKIISEVGEKTDETYQVYKDADTSIDQYKVKLPLFEDKTVLVDYNPNLLPGHFYFPAFKDARVLLALEYDRAWIKRYLDWRPGARLPADSQGNHILLGKSDKSQTTINHIYVDEKPVLNVKRLQEKDTQTIVLKDGTLTIEVKEEK